MYLRQNDRQNDNRFVFEKSTELIVDTTLLLFYKHALNNIDMLSNTKFIFLILKKKRISDNVLRLKAYFLGNIIEVSIYWDIFQNNLF